MIDVLRASTTVGQALEAGAECVIPVETVAEARQRADELRDSDPLLGGERDGELIPGFDLDNSPLRYTAEAVAGRPIVFTTTNGTRALLQCGDASRILIGAFVNLRAVVDETSNAGGDVHLVCAGTHGEVTSEDVLFAGAVAVELIATNACEQNDQSHIASQFYRWTMEQSSIHQALCDSRGGRNLLQLGHAADIARAAELSRHHRVPEYSPATGRIE